MILGGKVTLPIQLSKGSFKPCNMFETNQNVWEVVYPTRWTLTSYKWSCSFTYLFSNPTHNDRQKGPTLQTSKTQKLRCHKVKVQKNLEVLLIEEILQQLIGSLFRYLQGCITCWVAHGGAGFLPSRVFEDIFSHRNW